MQGAGADVSLLVCLNRLFHGLKSESPIGTVYSLSTFVYPNPSHRNVQTKRFFSISPVCSKKRIGISRTINLALSGSVFSQNITFSKWV